MLGGQESRWTESGILTFLLYECSACSDVRLGESVRARHEVMAPLLSACSIVPSPNSASAFLFPTTSALFY